MFQHGLQGLFDRAAYGLGLAEDNYGRALFRLTLIGFLWVLALWGFNVWGLYGVNSFILMLTLWVMLAFGLYPRWILGVIGLGALGVTLRKGDTMLGAWKGLTTWYYVVLNAIFFVLLVAWWLTVMPYGKAPFTFFYHAGLFLFLWVTVLKFEIGGNWLRNIVVAVTLKILVFSIIDTLTGNRLGKALSDTWESVLAYTFDESTPAAAAGVASSARVLPPPATVTVPLCTADDKSWSVAIRVKRPGIKRLDWDENWPTKHRFVSNGKLVKTTANGKFHTNSISFCVTNPDLANTEMDLTWVHN